MSLLKVGSSALEKFTALLGEDAFFVPCEWGAKKPLLTYPPISALARADASDDSAGGEDESSLT